MDSLLRYISEWPANTWFNFLVAIAVLLQAYVALKLWRPRVELFFELIQQKSSMSSFELFVHVANLSGVGIFIEALEIVVTDLISKETGVPHRFLMRSVFPPYADKSTECQQAVLQAHPDGKADDHGYRHSRVQVSLLYRVHSKWFDTPSKKYIATIGVFDIPSLGEERSLLDRMGPWWRRARPIVPPR
jgi:hypothetical protein